MRIKSYFSRTVEDAIALASQELGPEAMLVDSRKAPPEARHLGEYEVVFATQTRTAAVVQTASAHPAEPLPGAALSAGDRLSGDVAQLKKELEGMRRALTNSALNPAPWAGASPDLASAYAVLTDAGLDPELAREIVQAAEKRAAERPAKLVDRTALERALAEEIESRVTVQPALGTGEARPRIVALVGPPGAGKTTTLVKLAVNYGLASRKPVMLLSTDTYRVAAAEQLRSFAAILGVGFQVLETTAALAQAIEEGRGKDLIFIDTPGLGCGDMDHGSQLAQFLASRNDIDTQLVVPSSMKPADLSRVVDAFEVFRPRRLLFTKLDETSSFGPILTQAVRTGKPLSFFTTGQRIPEDLEAVSRGRLVDLVCAGSSGQVAPAA